MHTEKSNDVSASLEKIAGGDPTGGGKDWLEGKSLSEWDDLEDVIETFKTTLRKVKVSVLDAQMKRAETLLVQVADFEGFVGAASEKVDITAVRKQYKRAAITRMTGVLVRQLMELEKDPAKVEPIRTKVRGEIKDVGQKIKSRIGCEMDYTKDVPKAVHVAVADIISMKRRR